MGLNGFDKIALIYDGLAKLVYGDSITKAQLYFLKEIKPGAIILILGGGSGRILPDLFRINPTCKVYFIDASKEMIALAKRQKFTGVIHFIHGTEENVPKLTFDCAITNFYLDLFSNDQLKKVILQIVNVLHHDAQWIVTDFVADKAWQRVMIKAMYLFFNLIAGVEATRLPSWRQYLGQKNIIQQNAASFYRGFIQTEFYVLAYRIHASSY